ncbi:hypothetical protein FACS1894122_15330 [Alphaproteobacteria bacterium]|nr:hypothetical protein FACS1894122_15330 [Alphaproteobacteria bacterium]
MTKRSEFEAVKAEYRANPRGFLENLLPDGKVEGRDYVAKNPRRNDKEAGSFRIDINTCRFNDFSSRDHGIGIIDLVMCLDRCDADTACVKLVYMLKDIKPSSLSFLASNCSDKNIKPAKKKKNDLNYIWKKSKRDGHPYLKEKQIWIGNARVNVYNNRRSLLVPLTDSFPKAEDDLDIKGMQSIGGCGEKRFLGESKDLFHIASQYDADRSLVILCEGYATAMSIYYGTLSKDHEKGFCTIATMSACNMKNVALRIRELLPESGIVINHVH